MENAVFSSHFKADDSVARSRMKPPIGIVEATERDADAAFVDIDTYGAGALAHELSVVIILVQRQSCQSLANGSFVARMHVERVAMVVADHHSRMQSVSTVQAQLAVAKRRPRRTVQAR